MKLLTTTCLALVLASPAFATGYHTPPTPPTPPSYTNNNTNTNTNTNNNTTNNTNTTNNNNNNANTNDNNNSNNSNSTNNNNSNSNSRSNSRSRSNSSSDNTNNVNVTNTSPDDVTVKSVPDVLAPALAAGANPCSGSASVAGSGVGFGFGLGSTLRDRNCELRATAALLSGLGYSDAARQLLCQDGRVRKAFADAGMPCDSTVIMAPPPAPVVYVPAHAAVPAVPPARVRTPAPVIFDTEEK